MEVVTLALERRVRADLDDEKEVAAAAVEAGVALAGDADARAVVDARRDPTFETPRLTVVALQVEVRAGCR